MSELKIVLNPDKDKAAEVQQAVKDNGGYCPCQFVKNPDTKCMCKEFREQTTPGLCHCQLYLKCEKE